jgi:hypothetical protein
VLHERFINLLTAVTHKILAARNRAQRTLMFQPVLQDSGGQFSYRIMLSFHHHPTEFN